MRQHRDEEQEEPALDEFLQLLQGKGVRLWSQHGQLHYKAPKGALTSAEIERLRESKTSIAALLETDHLEQPPEAALQFNRAPLSFSQLAHWHLYQLGERPAIRQIASAIRLSGRLDVDTLSKSLAAVIQRHEALRTQIVSVDGVPMQEIRQTSLCTLQLADLTSFPEVEHDTQIRRRIEDLILEPVNIGADSLLSVRLLKITEREHVLISGIEHTVSDAYSMGVFLKDLFSIYVRIINGLDSSDIKPSIQFPDYTTWQRNTHAAWLEQHFEFWRKRLPSYKRLRFPEDDLAVTNDLQGWDEVSLRVERNLADGLRTWCRDQRTTVVMAFLTAYIALVLRWCNASELTVQYVIDGRSDPRSASTIGYFASTLYLHLELMVGDTFATLLPRVTEEYCKAAENDDSFYMQAQSPRPEFARNTTFNWVPGRGRGLDLSALNNSDKALAATPIAFKHPMLKTHPVDNEPSITLSQLSDEVIGAIYFPCNRFSRTYMQKFAQNLLQFIELMTASPNCVVEKVVPARKL